MSQDDVARHGGADGDTKLACRKVMWLGTKMPKATQSLHIARKIANVPFFFLFFPFW